jgi:hypothetical protein
VPNTLWDCRRVPTTLAAGDEVPMNPHGSLEDSF